MSLDIKDLQEKYNLFDTDGKLIVANLIKCLNFVYSHLGDSVKANDEGDLEVGRNLEVDGNATINSELELGESGDIGANLSNAIATSLQGNFTKLYKHTLNGTMVNGIGDETTFNNLVIISNYEETVDSATKLETLLANCLSTQSGTLEQIGATYYLMAFNYTNRKFVAMYNNSVNTIGIDVPTSLVEGFTDTKVLL